MPVLGVMHHPTVQVGGFNFVGAIYLGVALLLMFFPLLLHRRGQSPGESDSDQGGGGGGGGGQRDPRVPPSPPPSGIPMDDARPASLRLRATGRLADHAPAPTRRPSHQPNRRRERTPSGR
jgi:hypothetical protein